MKIAWNTGRLYAKEGQPMTAEVIGDKVVFVDHARGIEGVFDIMMNHCLEHPRDLARHVMYLYDRGQARYHMPFGTLEHDSKTRQMVCGYAGWIADGATPVDHF